MKTDVKERGLSGIDAQEKDASVVIIDTIKNLNLNPEACHQEHRLRNTTSFYYRPM